jgi:hypothetical protein
LVTTVLARRVRSLCSKFRRGSAVAAGDFSVTGFFADSEVFELQLRSSHKNVSQS